MIKMIHVKLTTTATKMAYKTETKTK